MTNFSHEEFAKSIGAMPVADDEHAAFAKSIGAVPVADDMAAVRDAKPPAPLQAGVPIAGDDNPLGSVGVAASELSRNIPILGPATVKAGHGLAAALEALTPDAWRREDLRGKTLGELYDHLEAQDKARQDQIYAAHPVAANLGALGGAAMLPIPGAGTEGMVGHAARIAGNAALGGVDAYVRSGDAGEAAQAGGIAGGLTAGLESLPYVGKALGWAAKKSAPLISRVTPGDVERYLANPEAVNSAKPLFDQTKDFLGKVDEVRGGLSGDSGDAYRMLKDSGKTVTPDQLGAPLKEAGDHLKSLGAYGADRKAAISGLNEMMADIAADASNGTLTLDKGKNLLTVLDSKIEQASRSGADAQVVKALRGARSEVNGMLREAVPGYAEHMDQLAGSTRQLVGVTDNFRTDKGAMQTLKRIQSGKDPFAGEALDNFDRQFGTSYAEDLQNSATNAAFGKDSTNGSRKTTPGALIGGAIGGFLAPGVGHIAGGIIGAGAGAIADRYGGQAVKAALDFGINVNKLAGSKYIQPIMDAASRGNKALAITHYLLSQTDPAYQNLQNDPDN